MKRILIKYLKKSKLDFEQIEMDNIIVLKKALKHDLLMFFRKASIRYYISQNRVQHNINCAKYMKKRYDENKDDYKLKKIEKITKYNIKKKAIKNQINDLEYLLN